MTYQEAIEEVEQKIPLNKILALLGDINGNVHQLTEQYGVTVHDVLMLRRFCPLKHVTSDELGEYLIERIKKRNAEPQEIVESRTDFALEHRQTLSD